MAADTAARHPRLRVSDIRSLDNLEAGVRGDAKPLVGRHRIRVHVPCSKVRSTYDIVRSWAIIGVTSSSFGAALALFEIRGHW